MNLKELKELIELIGKKDFTEFEIERQGFRMRISRSREQTPQTPLPAAAPLTAPPYVPATGAQPEAPKSETSTAPASQPAETAGDEIALHTIKSPMPGTFYRASSPTSNPFVKVGDHVDPETVVCIIEAMKLMNPIQAEVTGEVVKIYVENGQPVEYGQPLFGIKT